MVHKATTAKRGGTQEAQRARAEETRGALLQTARAIFSEAGYHVGRTVALVARAQVTSGALYHHLHDKKTLFEAVFLDVLDEMRRAAETLARHKATRWDRITASFDNYLALGASSPKFLRIVLIVGPAVLGWSRWHDLLSQHVTAGIKTTLRLLIADGEVVDQATAPLANLLQGALNEAALSIAHAAEPQSAKEDVSRPFGFLLDGLRRSR